MASTVSSNASRGSLGASTMRGKSPLAPCTSMSTSRLLRLGRHPGRGAGPLAVDDDEADLGRAEVADRLLHERDAGPGRRGHRPRPGHRGAERHVDRRQLVLGLDGHAAELRQPRREPFEDLRRRRDRVAGEEPPAGDEEAERDGLVAGHQQPVAGASRRRASTGALPFGDAQLRRRSRSPAAAPARSASTTGAGSRARLRAERLLGLVVGRRRGAARRRRTRSRS